MPDRAADGGEGRLVFALTDGDADANASSALPLTVILEYAQVGSASDWAARWHALGAASDTDFPARLAGVASSFVDAGSLAQIRTADQLTGGALVLHEFHLESGALVATRVRNTPDWNVVPESDIRAFATYESDAIASGTDVLPTAWLARSSTLGDTAPPYVSALANRDALIRGTCAGCHAQTDDGFQIDPRATGDAKLSRFLVDPTKPLDEIGRRTEWMKLTLSGSASR
jgi:hypothetical protein